MRKIQNQVFQPSPKTSIYCSCWRKKDVFVNLPTGFGKSLIYQALPLIFDEITGVSGHMHVVVVISPLLNLIQDQV